MRQGDRPLRLPSALLTVARKAAEQDGMALNQWIAVAVAEKLSALRVESYFQERAARADRRKAL